MATNFDKIKEMNIDELTEFFVKKNISCIKLMRTTQEGKILPCGHPLDWCDAKQCIKQWLESEAK